MLDMLTFNEFLVCHWLDQWVRDVTFLYFGVLVKNRALNKKIYKIPNLFFDVKNILYKKDVYP